MGVCRSGFKSSACSLAAVYGEEDCAVHVRGLRYYTVSLHWSSAVRVCYTTLGTPSTTYSAGDIVCDGSSSGNSNIGLCFQTHCASGEANKTKWMRCSSPHPSSAPFSNGCMYAAQGGTYITMYISTRPRETDGTSHCGLLAQVPSATRFCAAVVPSPPSGLIRSGRSHSAAYLPLPFLYRVHIVHTYVCPTGQADRYLAGRGDAPTRV